MSRVAIVTTADTATLDAAGALGRSVDANWPNADLKILTSSRLNATSARPKVTGMHVTKASLVHDTGFNSASILSESDELALALPRFLAHQLADYESCIFIGPGLLVTRTPTELISTSQEGGVGVVVPAIVTPLYSLTPSLGSIERGPVLPETRVVAVTDEGRGFLEAWARTCDDAVLDIDQRTVKWAADVFLQRAISRRDVTVEGDHTFLHWSDYAGVEGGRATGPTAAIVGCDELFTSVRETTYSDDPEVAWSMLVHRVHDSRPVEPLLSMLEQSKTLPNPGQEETPFDLLRADIRRAVDPFGRRWGNDADGSFDEWLFEKNEAGCTRVADLVVRAHPELAQEFPGARSEPALLRAWVAERGRDLLGFDPFDPGYSPRTATENKDLTKGSFRRSVAWRWNTLKTMVPGHNRRATRRLETAYLGPDPGETRGLSAPKLVSVQRKAPLWGSSHRGLNILGPFRSESGLGQASRASLDAIRLLGHPFTHIDTTEKYPSRNAIDVGLDHSTHGQHGNINLIHSNADEMLTLETGAFKHRFGGRFNAAMWFWETADLPKRSRPAFDIVDELWVASTYQADVFGQYARVPVHVIGLAADLPQRREVDRTRYEWRDNDLVFLFVYDALSSYGRKNPRLVMDSFVSAFAPRFEDVRLVVKVSNLNKFPASQKELLGLAERYPAITVIDDYLKREEVMDLMAASDVYVSLHAAEGFGLTLLEAMAMGTPVICTGYSGNMDFTTNHNSWLVDYDMIRIEERTGPYPEGSVWASPRIEDAIEVMRSVDADRSEIINKGKRARDDALKAASLESYASRLDEQLKRVL